MIYLTGDTHGSFGRFSKKCFDAENGDFLIICGDFGGIWDGSKNDRYWINWLSEKKYTVLFIDGNHENYDLLNSYPVSEWNGGSVHKITDKLIHLMRGQVYTIEGHSFFTMGGAASHDIKDGILDKDASGFQARKRMLTKRGARFRINRVNWWREELPSEEELIQGREVLAANNNCVDVILTHCAPTSVHIGLKPEYNADRLTDFHEEVCTSCNFKAWFFGHYHDDRDLGNKMTLLYKKIVRLDEYLK